MKRVHLILWDQLNRDISSLQTADPKSSLIVFIEALREAQMTKHHVKKLVFLFSAMRHFAKELEKEGFDVLYIPIEKREPTLTSGIKRVQAGADEIVVTMPGEYRVYDEISKWKKTTILEDERFFCSIDEFSTFAKGKKRLLMESFYQKMRKKSGLLLTKTGLPEGGKWNFDQENREPIRGKVTFPKPPLFPPDQITKKVIAEVKKLFPKHFGILEGFSMPVTRKSAEQTLRDFIAKKLPRFGPNQDAMLIGEPFLFHSLLSASLNAGLLLPSEVCEAVEKAYRAKKVPIASAEGFIRQILGWREYVRGIYWLQMPKYKEFNFLKAKRKLPSFYWSGETQMSCLSEAIAHTKKHAYSHHIQRLMVTGNFALLIGVLPKEICDWYLAVYADAHEWVELPNTLGMSQFADGGLLATKPYISSGSYINKMSNFCKKCHYSVGEKEGEKACPFNYLYWNFLMQHEKLLRKNPRLSMPYRTLDKFSSEKKRTIQADSKRFLASL